MNELLISANVNMVTSEARRKRIASLLPLLKNNMADRNIQEIIRPIINRIFLHLLFEIVG